MLILLIFPNYFLYNIINEELNYCLKIFVSLRKSKKQMEEAV